MKKFYKFAYLKNQKESYRFDLGDVPYITDICEELENRIMEGSGYVSDVVNELADSHIDIYTADLYSTCATPDFAQYINKSVAELGTPEVNEDYLTKLYQQAEFVYYQEALYDNIDFIGKNALINMLQGEVLMIECSDDKYSDIEDSIYEFTNDYLDNIEMRDFDRCDELLDDFYDKLQEHLEDNKDIEATKKYSDNTDDDDFCMRGLYVAPFSEPQVIKLSRIDELQQLQSAVDGYIEVINIENQVTHKNYCLICNEEGKINGLPENIPLYKHYFGYAGDNEICDFINGNAVLLADDGEDFGSLNEDDIAYWSRELNNEMSLGTMLLSFGEPANWDISTSDDDISHYDYTHDNHDDCEL